MKYALVNGEYEHYLFADKMGQPSDKFIKKERKVLEFLFFFINQDHDIGLANETEFSTKFLNYLESLDISIPEFGPVEGAFNWFGKCSNLDLERKLNSKVWTYNYLVNQMNFEMPFKVIDNESEVKEFINNSKHNEWMLKSPYKMGGYNIKCFTKGDEIPSFSGEQILEPFYNRVRDFALYYDPKTNDSFFYSSLMNKKGFYVGGQLYENEEGLDESIKKQPYFEAYNKLKKECFRILEKIKEYPLEQPLTIDSFIYKEADEYKIHPMCEINYRVNMGSLLKSLKKFIPTNGYGEIITLFKCPIIDYDKFPKFNLKTKTGVIFLQDEQFENRMFFIAGKDIKAVSKMRAILFSYNKVI